MIQCMIGYGRSEVEQILQWCISKWGLSDYATTKPRLRVYKTKGTTYNIKAEYNSDKNIISIYLGAIYDFEELCGIVIHEYWHYLLNPMEFDEIYDELINNGYNERNYYIRHKHELLCNEKQTKHAYKCMCEIINKK